MVKLRTRLQTDAGVAGTARTDRRTTALLPRLRSGDVAVLDHVDLDGPTAEALVEAGVVAVVNRSPMISGRFPNRCLTPAFHWSSPARNATVRAAAPLDPAAGMPVRRPTGGRSKP